MVPISARVRPGQCGVPSAACVPRCLEVVTWAGRVAYFPACHPNTISGEIERLYLRLRASEWLAPAYRDFNGEGGFVRGSNSVGLDLTLFRRKHFRPWPVRVFPGPRAWLRYWLLVSCHACRSE